MATIPTISTSVGATAITATINSNAGDDHVELQRQYAGGDWVTLSNDIPVGTGQTYSDNAVAHNQTAFYRAVAFDSGGGSATSLVASATQTLEGPVVHEVVRLTHTNKNGASLDLNSQEGVNRTSERAESIQDMPGLEFPVIDVGVLVARSWTIPLIFTDPDDIVTIRSWRDERAVLCVRNGTGGESMFAVIPEDAIEEGLYGSGSLTFVETDYREEINT